MEKIVKRLYAVLDKDFEFEYYNKMVYEAGMKFRIGRRYGNELNDDGLVVVAGHGADFLIPKGFFHLEEEVIERVEKKRVRRV